MAELQFDRHGPTWLVSYPGPPTWPVVLEARLIYPGTGRLLSTLRLIRRVEGREPVRVHTEQINLLIDKQRADFARASAAKLKEISEASQEGFQRAIGSMLDGLTERLLDFQSEADIVSVADVELPDDLAPKYTAWPFVPTARPGLAVGPKGSTKSTLGRMVSLSIATGYIFHPRIEPRVRGPVLYVGQEEDRQQFTRELQMICNGYGLPRPRDIYYMKLANASLIDSVEIIAEAISVRGAVLVIIDSAQATWGAAEQSVREYASRWFNAVDQLGAPAWVLDHPNRVDTHNGKAGTDYSPAGTTVKTDRVGHWWSVDKVEIPTGQDEVWRYHVTLSDGGRNYVARQPDITYEIVREGYRAIHFEETGPLTAETIVDTTRLFREMTAAMRQTANHEEGWTIAELTAAVGQKSDRRVRSELRTSDLWRVSRDGGYAERIVRVHGGGQGRGNAARFALETKMPEMREPPGGEVLQ